jgi:Fe2+ transport system protein FeoA
MLRNSEASRIIVEPLENIIDLFSAPEGFYQVCRLNGGNFFNKKMNQKSIDEGVKIHKEKNNSILILEKNKKVSLGKGELNKILVSPFEKGEK